MAIIDCRVWGVTEGAFDQVQRAGQYVVRFQVQTNAVHGVIELLELCENQGLDGGVADPAKKPIPKEYATYDYTGPLGSMERDVASFVKRRTCQLRDEESGFYNWWIDIFYDRLEPGEIPPLDDEGNLITNPLDWPVVYDLQTFTVSRIVDRGIPKDAQVRDYNATVWGGTSGFVNDFQMLPTEPQNDRFVQITNQAGDLPTEFRRENYTYPMLVADAYVADLYTFNKDISRARGTANKDVFFNNKPGYVKFKDGVILGGRRYESERGKARTNATIYYKVRYRWELWGGLPDLAFGSTRYQSVSTNETKERPKAEVLVANEGLNAWSAAAPSGDLQPITLTNSSGETVTAFSPWPLEEDGTSKAQDDATVDTYGWWFLLPYDYTQMAGGKIGKNWPKYDYVKPPERAN